MVGVARAAAPTWLTARRKPRPAQATTDTDLSNMQARWLLLTLLCVLLLAIGQVLFKSAAGQWRVDGWSWGTLRSFLSPALIAGLVLYAMTTVLWVYILRTVPLTLAYSVYALAFVFVPLLAYLFFEETLTLNTLLGSALIVAGVIVTVR